MDLPNQKNFYDTKRQFQGKDQPTDTHPASHTRGPSLSQVVFGLVFLAFIGFLAFLRVKAAREELVPTEAAAPAAKQAPAQTKQAPKPAQGH